MIKNTKRASLMSYISPSDIASAAGRDVANSRMRSAGRKAWNRNDYNAAAAEYGRIIDQLEKGRYETPNAAR